MVYPKIALAQTVIQLCKAKGVEHIIISPGSRNAPLTIGFTNDPFFKCYSIVDERCAAFFAMGIAEKINTPAAVVCTSGSALLNYYPAVAEAFYSDIPLVVLSADRPKHLVGIGDGQTINQKNVFDKHIIYSANLKLDLQEEEPVNKEELPILKNLGNAVERLLNVQEGIQEYNEQEINTAINLSKLKKGPVHINVPFAEPLYEVVERLSVSPKTIAYSKETVSPIEIVSEAAQKAWSSAQKKMVLVGVHQPNSVEQRWLDVLANDNSVIVLTETTSNLHNNQFFPSIDQIIAPLSDEEQQLLQPDILLTFGGLIVSKKIKALLRKYQPKAHWHVDEKKANDTFFCLSNHFKTTPNTFFSELFAQLPKAETNDYRSHWTKVKHHRLQKHDAYLKKIPFCDFSVFDSILKNIPKHSILQVGNSSAIRYTQLFAIDPSLEVYCNRGTSGIDGSTSTALGCAVASKKRTTFISGDLSFFYDSNALWNNYIPNNFRIIIINNQGGGIFRILPGHKNTENFDTYFETNHKLTAEHLCGMFGFEYHTASEAGELEIALTSFFNPSEKPRLLEIFTPKTINDEILLNYFPFIK